MHRSRPTRFRAAHVSVVQVANDISVIHASPPPSRSRSRPRIADNIDPPKAHRVSL